MTPFEKLDANRYSYKNGERGTYIDDAPLALQDVLLWLDRHSIDTSAVMLTVTDDETLWIDWTD